MSIVAVFDFCAEDGVLKTFQIVGYMLILIKVLVPLLLIIFGSIDFGKAMMAGDDKGIQSASRMLVIRAAAGIIIFFIPTLINFVTSLIGSWSGIKSEFSNCWVCMFETSKCETKRNEACKAKTNNEQVCVWNSDLDTCDCQEV